jgi:hypothetical protein
LVLARATSSRLKQRGVFSVGSDGLIDLKKARAAIVGNRSIAHAYMDDVNERQRGVVPAASTEPPLTGEPLVEDSPEPGTTATTRRQFERARTIRESFNASMARLQFQERSGLLVERMGSSKPGWECSAAVMYFAESAYLCMRLRALAHRRGCGREARLRAGRVHGRAPRSRQVGLRQVRDLDPGAGGAAHHRQGHPHHRLLAQVLVAKYVDHLPLYR